MDAAGQTANRTVCAGCGTELLPRACFCTACGRAVVEPVQRATVAGLPVIDAPSYECKPQQPSVDEYVCGWVQQSVQQAGHLLHAFVEESLVPVLQDPEQVGFRRIGVPLGGVVSAECIHLRILVDTGLVRWSNIVDITLEHKGTELLIHTASCVWHAWRYPMMAARMLSYAGIVGALVVFAVYADELMLGWKGQEVGLILSFTLLAMLPLCISLVLNGLHLPSFSPARDAGEKALQAVLAALDRAYWRAGLTPRVTTVEKQRR